ncbi:MAG: hypothetical protein ACYDCS_02965 [Candidatus Dormibacteria bacterium]
MSRIVALGEDRDVLAFAMIGVDVIAVTDASATRDEWASLPDDVGLVILTRDSAAALGSMLHQPSRPLWAVMP